MIRRISVGSILCICCLLTGCVEQSVVVKVKPDGSGVVHVRKHVQNSSFLKSDNQESPIPTDENANKLVAAFGKNARLSSLKKSVNHNGWSGYDLIIAFDDVNQIVLPDNMENILEGKASESSDKQQLEMNFNYADGLLEIETTGFADDEKRSKPEADGAVNPFASEPSSPLAAVSIPDAAMLEIIAKVAADAKVGVFVQIDGTVTESNAKHRKDNLITLMRAGIGEVLDEPSNVAKLKQLEENDLTRAAATKLADTIKGFDADFQPSIKIQFK